MYTYNYIYMRFRSGLLFCRSCACAATTVTPPRPQRTKWPALARSSVVVVARSAPFRFAPPSARAGVCVWAHARHRRARCSDRGEGGGDGRHEHDREAGARSVRARWNRIYALASLYLYMCAHTHARTYVCSRTHALAVMYACACACVSSGVLRVLLTHGYSEYPQLAPRGVCQAHRRSRGSDPDSLQIYKTHTHVYSEYSQWPCARRAGRMCAQTPRARHRSTRARRVRARAHDVLALDLAQMHARAHAQMRANTPEHAHLHTLARTHTRALEETRTRARASAGPGDECTRRAPLRVLGAPPCVSTRSTSVREYSEHPFAGPGDEFTLVGHKWFTSAPMSDAFLTLAHVSTR
jgi:hypothetical protein